MSYRQLLANLEALPEEERQLSAFRYIYREDGKEVCGCVLGKGLPSVRDFVRGSRSFNPTSIASGVFRHLDLAGMTLEEADTAQDANDYGDDEGSDEPGRRERYARMIDWLRARVAEEVTSAASAAEGSP